MNDMWDAEVDIACIGAGIGGLVNAIATVDAGGEVLVADLVPTLVDVAAAPGMLRERTHVKRNWLIGTTLDEETNEYFTALAEGTAERTEFFSDGSVPVRIARNLSRDEAHGQYVETFVGSRLTDWAAQCLSSPYGLMHTSMRDRRTTTMRTPDGDSIDVFAVGSMEWSDGGGGKDPVRQWAAEQARQRGITVRTGNTMDRVVFEEGVIVGVVLATPEGPFAVRTRAGVTFSPTGQDPVFDDGVNLVPGDRVQVCLVCQPASRFVRVELLTTEPVAPPRPVCTGSRGQFREGMHESRQPYLEGWRCGKVHGYPPLGQ